MSSHRNHHDRSSSRHQDRSSRRHGGGDLKISEIHRHPVSSTRNHRSPVHSSTNQAKSTKSKELSESKPKTPPESISKVITKSKSSIDVFPKIDFKAALADYEEWSCMKTVAEMKRFEDIQRRFNEYLTKEKTRDRPKSYVADRGYQENRSDRDHRRQHGRLQSIVGPPIHHRHVKDRLGSPYRHRSRERSPLGYKGLERSRPYFDRKYQSDNHSKYSKYPRRD